MLLRGTLFTLTMATSGPQLPTHHPSPPSSTHCRPKSPLWRLHTGSQADGTTQPAVWTPVSATLMLTLSARAGNSERIPKNPTPSFEGRKCLSKPARSQPQL